MLGARIASARGDAGLSQDELGQAVHLDRSAISRLEKGERKLHVPELVEIAATLGRPLSYFVAEPVPAVTSRRGDLAHAHGVTRALDVELEMFAADVRTVLGMALLPSSKRYSNAHVPRDHDEAERLAQRFREEAELADGPVSDLGAACERLGLYTYSAPLGEDGPDGGCVEVVQDESTVGAAVINGEAPAGRRRMTLVHELGHWLFGDAYDRAATSESERMINSFAIHFLAPRAGVHREWRRRASWSDRDRAIAVGAAFRLSWSATIAQLKNIGILDFGSYQSLGDSEPRYGDYLRLRLNWIDELESPDVSSGFAAAVLTAYSSGRLTDVRSIELLRGKLSIEELPDRPEPSLDDLRPAFAEHDD